MRNLGKEFLLGFLLVCLAAPAAWSARPQSPGQPRQQKEAKEGVIVGRLSLAEGEILRYVPEQKDWVVAVKDSPFGLEDALYSGENSKAEFLIPNGTWMRIGANSQVQVIALKSDATEVDVASGMARFIGRNDKTVLKATTPFGYALGEPGSAFDVYVGDQSVEIIALRGNVDFVHDTDGTRYDLTPGAMSILADNKQTSAGDGKVDSQWDDWNISRDTVLAKNIETKGESVRYLPEGIREDARVLDENGRWDRVYYEGQYRQVWRPTYVDSGWAPYTVGRWTDWYGDYTWIPYEPWGYTTSHYGYWFQANDYWYWAPPVVSVGFGVPYWGIGFSWYPGRVGWLYSDVSIGWFPLLPWEPYYAHRWWGPWGFPWRGDRHHHYDYARFHNFDHARVIRHGDFTRNNYAGLATPADRAALRNQFRTSPVVNNQMLGSVGNSRDRFNFTNRTPTTRPDSTVTARVDRNAARFSQVSDRVNGRTIQQQASTARTGRPTAGAQVATPGISSGTAGGSRALVGSPRTVQPSTTSRLGAVQSGRGAGAAARSGRNQTLQGTGAAGTRSQQFSTGRQQTSRSPAGFTGSGRSSRDSDISGRSVQSPRSGMSTAPGTSQQFRATSPSGRQGFQGRSAAPSYQGRSGGSGFSGSSRGSSMQSAPRSGYSGPRGGAVTSAPRGGGFSGAPRGGGAPMMSAPRGGGGGGGGGAMAVPRGGGGPSGGGGGGFGGGGRR
ncbi:MAG: FecR domain-containing protein [Desulfobacteraceae bacterium]|nr:FecR domain-containing protein [Desulfobacteraceae bacterium]